MGRSMCCAKEGLNKGAWTAMEDRILMEYIKVHGKGRWRNLPKRAGLKRCGKSCRLRWLNYLRPDIKRGNITPDEEELIIRLHKLLGNRWSLIAGRLPGRTDNEIKNHWNTNLGKRVSQHDQSNSVITIKHPRKTHNDKKKKKLASTTPTQPIEYNVVRTKAVRCTKIFIDPKPQLQPQQPLQKTDHAEIPTNDMVPQASSTYCNGDSWVDNSSSTIEEENKMLSDFMVDEFSVGDFNLFSELLNSEFSEICEFSEGSGNTNNLSPNSPEKQLVFSQELLEYWLGDQHII